MEEKGLDALLVTGDYGADENYQYLTSHRSHTRKRPTVMILPKSHDPALIVNWTAKRRAIESSWVKDIRVYEYEGLKSELIKEVLQDLGLSEAKIGAELNDPFDAFRINMRYEEFKKLQREMPKAEFLDASDILWRLRMIKTKAEMECLRNAMEITDRAYDAWYSTIKAGMTEKEAMRILYNLFVEERTAYGAPLNEIPCLILLGGRGDLPGRPGDRPLRRGEWVRIDGGAQYKGYCADFSRGGVVGKPSEKQKRSWEMAIEMTQKSLDAVKPGAKISDIVKAAIKTQRRLGFSTEFLEKYHMGHGIGLNIPEPPMVIITNDMPIEPGMVLTVEPFVFLGSPVVEQDFIVTETGYELISTARTDLHVIQG